MALANEDGLNTLTGGIIYSAIEERGVAGVEYEDLRKY
jgi:hypothetical protein